MVYDRKCKVIVMLSDLVEGGQVRITIARGCMCFMLWFIIHLVYHSGGVLPILAQQWITEVWGVHSGDSGGGGTAGLCVEDFKCSACQGQSRAYALRYTITEYISFAV